MDPAPGYDVVATGPDAPELAAVLRWPALDGGGFGFRGLPRAAAVGRYLAARRVIDRLGLEVVVPSPA